jgi:hypothetical protein
LPDNGPGATFSKEEIMKIIRTNDAEFERYFKQIRERGRVFDPELWTSVGRIVEDVALRGDEALFDYTAKWDGHVVTAATIEASPEERKEAAAGSSGSMNGNARKSGQLRTKRGWSSVNPSFLSPGSESMRRGDWPATPLLSS